MEDGLLERREHHVEASPSLPLRLILCSRNLLLYNKEKSAINTDEEKEINDIKDKRDERGSMYQLTPHDLIPIQSHVQSCSRVCSLYS